MFIQRICSSLCASLIKEHLCHVYNLDVFSFFCCVVSGRFHLLNLGTEKLTFSNTSLLCTVYIKIDKCIRIQLAKIDIQYTVYICLYRMLL